MNIVSKIQKYFDLAVKSVLVTCVFGMLIFSLLTIILRWMSTSLPWLDPLVRHLVFFSAFLGGTLAVAQDKHIAIDLVKTIVKFEPGSKIAIFIHYFVQVSLLIILLVLCKAGVDLVQVEMKYGKADFLGIHTSILIALMPFGFSLMAFRVFLKLFEPRKNESMAND
jgi:TRAP-type C4-dicarboxylate transport system permease small subunit